MSQLIPCPGCSRHVRRSEAECPFCSAALSLGQVTPPIMPRSRLGRAATFAFRASVVGAATLVSCGDDDNEGNTVPVYGSPPTVTYGGQPSFPGAGGGAAEAGDFSTALGGNPSAGQSGAGVGGDADAGAGGISN